MLSTMKVLEIYKHINMLKVNNLSQGFLCLEPLEGLENCEYYMDGVNK